MNLFNIINLIYLIKRGLLPFFYAIIKMKDIPSRIVEIEWKLTKAVRNGHRASDIDEYSHLRIEVDMLRCIYYGLDSPYCKLKR